MTPTTIYKMEKRIQCLGDVWCCIDGRGTIKNKRNKERNLGKRENCRSNIQTNKNKKKK